MTKIVCDCDEFMTEYNVIKIEAMQNVFIYVLWKLNLLLICSSFLYSDVYLCIYRKRERERENTCDSIDSCSVDVFVLCIFFWNHTRTHSTQYNIQTHWTMLWMILNHMAVVAALAPFLTHSLFSLLIHSFAFLFSHSIPYLSASIYIHSMAIISSLRRQHKYDKRAVIEYLMTWILIYESKRERITKDIDGERAREREWECAREISFNTSPNKYKF